MKLPAMFDQNPSHTFDKIVKKLITLSKLDVDPKCQGHSRNQKVMTWGTHNMPPKKKLSIGSLSNWCNADADNSKTICQPPPYGGRHNNLSAITDIFTIAVESVPDTLLYQNISIFL